MKSRHALLALPLALCSCVTFAVPRDMSILGGAPSDAAPTATSTAPHKYGSSVPWGGDLAGSSNVHQYVASISGSGGAGGTVPISASTLKETGSSLSVADSTAVVRDVLDMTHGRITAGGGGSDYSAVIGPRVGGETGDAMLWLLPNGTSPNGTSNWAIDGNGTALNFNSISGDMNFDTGGVARAKLTTDPTLSTQSLQVLDNGHVVARITGTGGTNAWMWIGADADTLGGNDYLFLRTTTQTRVNAVTGTTMQFNVGDVNEVSINSTAYTELLPATIGSTTGTNSLVGAAQVTTRSASASFTIDTTTTDRVVIADTSGGVFTITLPAPTNGRVITLIDPAGGSGSSGWALHNLTLARHGTEKINGTSASKVLSGQQWTCDVYSNGTDWFTSCS